MIESKKIIEILEKNYDENDFLSMFYSGSVPKILKNQSDLDIFVIVSENQKNNFFEKTVKLMSKYLDTSVTYSFFRGPIKYKNKALLHFLVYTFSENDLIKPSKESILNEQTPILNSIINNSIAIKGIQIRDILNKINLSNTKNTKNDNSRLKEKYELLLQGKGINYPEWKKTKDGWQMLRTKKYPSEYYKNYLISYFSKHLEK